MKDYPYFETKKTVKKISRLKRRVYRADNIGRQSRPLEQNKKFFFLKIRGRSIERFYEGESASKCTRRPACGQGKHIGENPARYLSEHLKRHYYQWTTERSLVSSAVSS